MEQLAYTVTATFPDEAMRAKYIAWLIGGHVEQVEERGGASMTKIVRQDEGLRVEVRYTFESRAQFEKYEREVAPALRAEGLRLFGPETGVVFARSTGVIVFNPFQIPF